MYLHGYQVLRIQFACLLACYPVIRLLSGPYLQYLHCLKWETGRYHLHSGSLGSSSRESGMQSSRGVRTRIFNRITYFVKKIFRKYYPPLTNNYLRHYNYFLPVRVSNIMKFWFVSLVNWVLSAVFTQPFFQNSLLFEEQTLFGLV